MSARILVVDDVETNVRLLEAKLTIEYYDVLTCGDGLSAIAIASSGLTGPRSRVSQRLEATMPRAFMSSVKELIEEIFFSIRAATNVPEPWRRVSSRSDTRPSTALRTVTREMP